MKKMPPPGKLPPNGSGSSPHNGRAEEPSFAERLARVEALVQSAATKTEFAAIKGEIELLSERTESIRRELKADIGLLNERIESVKRELNQKIESEVGALRSEMKAEMAELRGELKAEMEALRAEMHANFVSTLRWTLGVMLGVIVPFFSAVLAILKFL